MLTKNKLIHVTLVPDYDLSNMNVQLIYVMYMPINISNGCLTNERMKSTLNQASIYIFASLLNTLILNQNPTPTISQTEPIQCMSIQMCLHY